MGGEGGFTCFLPLPPFHSRSLWCGTSTFSDEMGMVLNTCEAKSLHPWVTWSLRVALWQGAGIRYMDFPSLPLLCGRDKGLAEAVRARMEAKWLRLRLTL